MKTTAHIIRKYRGNKSRTEFAQELSTNTFWHKNIGRQHVANWERGDYYPDFWMMVYLRDHATNETKQMAIEVIQAIQNQE